MKTFAFVTLALALNATAALAAGPEVGTPFNIRCQADERNSINPAHRIHENYDATVAMTWGEDNFKNPIAQGEAKFSDDKSLRLVLQFGTFRTSAYVEATTTVKEWTESLSCKSSAIVFGYIDATCSKPGNKDYVYKVTCYTNSWADRAAE